MGAARAPKSILVVEPDPDTGALLVAMLAAEGHAATLVESPAEAGRLLERSTFDLIITEAFGQRGVSCLDPAFLEEIKAHSGSIPIVLCSTYVSTSVIRPGSFGLAAVVSKPFEMDDLLQKVGRLLKEQGPLPPLPPH